MFSQLFLAAFLPLFIVPVEKEMIITLDCHRGGAQRFAFSSDETVIATGDGYQNLAGTVRTWDVASGKLRWAQAGHLHGISALAFNPNGKMIASAGSDGTIILWNSVTGKQLANLAAHKDSVKALCFSPDGFLLASAGDDKRICLWDMKTEQLLRTLTGHQQAISSVAFMLDGKTLASASWDLTVKLWDVGNGTKLTSLKHDGPVIALSCSPNGRFIVTGTWGNVSALKGDGTETWRDLMEALDLPSEALVWDWAKSEIVQRYKVPKGQVSGVVFSPDGSNVAVGTTNYSRIKNTLFGGIESRPGAIHLWDRFSGKAEKPLLQPSHGVTCISYSRNGRWLAYSGTEGIVRIQRLGQ